MDEQGKTLWELEQEAMKKHGIFAAKASQRSIIPIAGELSELTATKVERPMPMRDQVHQTDVDGNSKAIGWKTELRQTEDGLWRDKLTGHTFETYTEAVMWRNHLQANNLPWSYNGGY